MNRMLLCTLGLIALGTTTAQETKTISASGETSVVVDEDCKARAEAGEGAWLSGSEEGYHCMSPTEGIPRKFGKASATPMPYVTIGTLIYREDGGDWQEFSQGMTLRAGQDYTFRINDSDLSNRGSYRLKLTPVAKPKPQPQPQPRYEPPAPEPPRPDPTPSIDELQRRVGQLESDISEVRAANEELTAANEELTRKVDEATKKLDEALKVIDRQQKVIEEQQKVIREQQKVIEELRRKPEGAVASKPGVASRGLPFEDFETWRLRRRAE